MLLLTSRGNEITITNLGTNRALLNGKQLSKETPAILKDGDVITLVEAKYQIIVQVFKRDSVKAEDKNNASDKKTTHAAVATSSSGGNGINTTSSPLRPPPMRSTPPHKKPDPSTKTTGGAEKPKANSSPASRSPIAITPAKTADVVSSSTAAAVPTNSANANSSQAQEQKSTSPQLPNDTNMMEIVDDVSESTSDSDKDKDLEAVARSSDISAESSFVCEDLSDSDNVSDSDD
ncbi:hypothetical protein BGZ95_009996 [Linnemannia exigua]|uniref:FHA domain-containing protein n=1 Tax=Linnemannia exigua TaxID=604196 RepID=A0AAD4DC27_9FUNG|nr:hypothetical protein BGZ95_009996 [Linnemannia exigua]